MSSQNISFESVLKDKEVTLRFIMVCKDDFEFWERYDAFFNQLRKTEWQRLYVNDHSKVYAVHYKKSGNVQKRTKRLKNTSNDVIVVKFEITFQVALNTMPFYREYNVVGHTKKATLMIHGQYHRIDFGASTAELLFQENYHVILENKNSIYVPGGKPNQHLFDGFLNGRRVKLSFISVFTNTLLRNHFRKASQKRVEVIVLRYHYSKKGFQSFLNNVTNLIRIAYIGHKQFYRMDFEKIILLNEFNNHITELEIKSL